MRNVTWQIEAFDLEDTGLRLCIYSSENDEENVIFEILDDQDDIKGQLTLKAKDAKEFLHRGSHAAGYNPNYQPPQNRSFKPRHKTYSDGAAQSMREHKRKPRQY